MARATLSQTAKPIEHHGEERSNDIRRRLAAVEPSCIRTFTPSAAVLARSAGSYHWTPEGRKLADFTSGVLVMNLGHNPARWWRRVHEYLGLAAATGSGNGPAASEHDESRSGQTAPRAASGSLRPAASEIGGEFLSAVTLNGYNGITEVELAATERLVAALHREAGGARCEQVLWAASGSEAIQKALWAALDRRAREDMILATRHGFHGKKGLAGAVTGSEDDPDRDERVRFLSFPREECIAVAARRKPLDLTPYEAELERYWKQFGSRICAVITEPYLGGGGSFHPQKEYIQLLERFCREHDLVFIFDEVQANFGRTGEMFAFTAYGVEPDIVVLGKGLGNGVAVSAAAGRADLFANMHYGEGSDTWSANPLSSAAVLATLDEFETTNVLDHAKKLAAVLEEGLLRLKETRIVANVRGEGVVWGIECCSIGGHAAGDVANACVEACYLGDAQGRAIHLLGPLAGKVLRISPPLVMPLDEARAYLDVIYDILGAVHARLTA